VTEPNDYITPAGWAKVKAELDELWKVERPRVTAEVQAAAALGDRSENAEYIYGKRRLREIDRRLRFLAKRLEMVKIVRPNPAERDRVFFGAWVTVEDEDGEEHRYQIVGTDEFDVDAGKISVASPLARAMLGKRLDDEFEARLPRGNRTYVIIDVEYEAVDAAPP
jgi:transcription elongation factor GreB